MIVFLRDDESLIWVQHFHFDGEYILAILCERKWIEALNSEQNVLIEDGWKLFVVLLYGKKLTNDTNYSKYLSEAGRCIFEKTWAMALRSS